MAKHFGHVPNGASVGGVGVIGGDMELTPGPKRSVRCWGADELSRRMGRTAAYADRNRIGATTRGLGTDTQDGARTPRPAREGAARPLLIRCFTTTCKRRTIGQPLFCSGQIFGSSAHESANRRSHAATAHLLPGNLAWSSSALRTVIPPNIAYGAPHKVSASNCRLRPTTCWRC